MSSVYNRPMPPVRPPRAAQFAAFLRLGALAFGGLGAAIALIDRDLVERRGWATAEDVRAALAFTKPLPGSTVVQVVAFLGWRLGRANWGRLDFNRSVIGVIKGRQGPLGPLWRDFRADERGADG